MLKSQLINNYILILVSTIPLSILVGPSVSISNIILVSLASFFFIMDKKFIFLFKDKIVLSFLIIIIYLFFNSLFSIDVKSGIYRNIGFFRYFLLFITINFIFINSKKTDLIFKTWLFIILIVVFDSYVEFFFKKNIMGYGGSGDVVHGYRIVSFFKDEQIVAAFLNGFVFIIIGYLFQNFKDKSFLEKFFIYLIVLSFLSCILFTGERSNGIKFLFGLFIFFCLNHHLKFKLKILTVLTGILIISAIYIKSDYIKLRYGGQLFSQLSDSKKLSNFIDNNIYINIYKSGFKVFKKYPILGVGNKNYRVETCNVKNIIENPGYYCVTHPHQIYIEFLAEHGILGSTILLSILFFLIFKNLKVMILSKNLLQIGAFIYLLISLLPLLPSGSFFNDFGSTLFWLNMSIFYASNPKTNIFKSLKVSKIEY